MLTIRVASPYHVAINPDLLEAPALHALVSSYGYRVAVIADEALTVYAQPLTERLGAQLFLSPAGEQAKTRANKARLEDCLLEHGYGRDTLIVALGGGTITDLAGFIASTFCRGVPVIYCPTSLLAMADACIGGKTGINTPMGKNLIGSFWSPAGIFMDTNTLRTLPASLWQEGLAEIIKHGLIHDAALFDRCRHPISCENITELLLASCRVKQHFIEQDPEESGLRQILNFGHTVGHAIEAATDYRIRHGQAVAFGMLAEATLSTTLGLLPDSALAHITSTLMPLLSKHFSELNIDTLLAFMSQDKKARAGIPHFVLLQAIGTPYIHEAQYSHPVEPHVVKAVLTQLCHGLSHSAEHIT